jgi:hypothetical protein
MLAWVHLNLRLQNTHKTSHIGAFYLTYTLYAKVICGTDDANVLDRGDRLFATQQEAACISRPHVLAWRPTAGSGE